MSRYGKLSTTFYDLDKPHPPPEALAFYCRLASEAGNPILEPMCGSGRFLVPMLQRGFDVTGVDASADMLAACRLRAGQLGLAPRLYQQYLHQMVLPSGYRFAMIPDGSFGLLTDPSEARQSLLRIYHALTQGATLCIELDQWHPPQDEACPEGERLVEGNDGSQIVMRSSGEWDQTGRLYRGRNRYDLVQAGRVVETEWEQFDLRYYLLEEFTVLLESAGFTNIIHHSAYDPRQPEDQSDSLVFLCTRR